MSKAMSSEHQRAWGKWALCECTLCVCVCVCTATPLLSSLPVHLLKPSLLKKGSSSSLMQGKEESEGKHLALMQHSLPRHPFPVSSRSAENQDLPPPCSWQRAARVPLLRGLQITSGTPQFGNPWYSIIIFLRSHDLIFLNNK